MPAIAVISSIFMTIVAPIPAVFLNLFLFLFEKRFRLVYAVALAMSLAIIARSWVPGPNVDLYYWHFRGQMFRQQGIEGLWATISSEYDPIKFIIIYLSSLMGDLNIMQSSTIFISYILICWMLSDFSKKHHVKTKNFAITAIFVLSVFRLLYAMSSMWYSTAIVFFALGIYLKDQKNVRWAHILCYIIALMTHTGTFALLIALVLSKIFRREEGKKWPLIVIGIITLLTGPILDFLYSVFSTSGVISSLYSMYIMYFLEGENWNGWGGLQGGWRLILAVTEILVCWLILGLCKKYNQIPKSDLFKNATIVVILALLLNATVFIRYACFIAIIIAPDMMNLLETLDNSRKKLIILAIIIACTIMAVASQIKDIINYSIVSDAWHNAGITLLDSGTQDGSPTF